MSVDLPEIGDKVLITKGAYICQGCINIGDRGKKCKGCPSRYKYTREAENVKATIKQIERYYAFSNYICTPLLEFGKSNKHSAHMIEAGYDDLIVIDEVL
jgi:hypothetical protein